MLERKDFRDKVKFKIELDFARRVQDALAFRADALRDPSKYLKLRTESGNLQTFTPDPPLQPPAGSVQKPQG